LDVFAGGRRQRNSNINSDQGGARSWKNTKQSEEKSTKTIRGEKHKTIRGEKHKTIRGEKHKKQ